MKESLEDSLGDAASVITPRTMVEKRNVDLMLKGVDRSGIAQSISEQLTEQEEAIQIAATISVEKMYEELDLAVLQSIREMKDIVTDHCYEVTDRISAVKALGTIGGYVNKRRENIIAKSNTGTQVNVIIDNSEFNA